MTSIIFCQVIIPITRVVSLLVSLATITYNWVHFPGWTILYDFSGATGGTASRSISEDPDELIHIGAVDIDIVHGDLTQEHTDAIVNSSDNTFSQHGMSLKMQYLYLNYSTVAILCFFK